MTTTKGKREDTTSYKAWKKMFDELCLYKLQNGNCLVPCRYPPNPKLSRWVMTQRRQFVLMKAGKTSAISAERVEELDKVGFVWCAREASCSKWHRRLEELAEYKAKHGNCNVKQRYSKNPQLGSWVNTQRRHYKLLMEGKPSFMTNERIQALEQLGFSWNIQKVTSSPADSSLSEHACMTETSESTQNEPNSDELIEEETQQIEATTSNSCESGDTRTISSTIGSPASYNTQSPSVNGVGPRSPIPAQEYVYVQPFVQNQQFGLPVCVWLCTCCGAKIFGSSRDASCHVAQCLQRTRYMS